MQVQEDFKPRESRRHPGLSRHFWELKADQVLNKVFDQQHAGSTSTSSKAFTDVEILNFKPHEKFQPLGWFLAIGGGRFCSCLLS